MKRSELKSQIKEEIISILSEADAEDIKAQQDLNKELETTKSHADELGDALSELDGSSEEGEEYHIDDPEGRTKDTTDDIYVHNDTEDMMLEDEDEEPTAAQLKGDSVSKIATHLQKTASDLKSTAKKWKNSEGEEKEKLRNRLVKLTKIKKELESML
jgi:broad specificity phosphatase PhoE|tara:strand:- start:996 stop:1469 length:474 start_codon:yes stop_codon:yes gene_type:complete